MTDAISSATSALGALSTSMAVTANNVANADTDGYQSRDARLATGPDGHGVQVADIARDTSPGSLLPEAMTSQNPSDAVPNDPLLAETSNVDLVRQVVSMMETSRAFEANTTVIRTEDQMAGSLLDMRV